MRQSAEVALQHTYHLTSQQNRQKNEIFGIVAAITSFPGNRKFLISRTKGRVETWRKNRHAFIRKT